VPAAAAAAVPAASLTKVPFLHACSGAAQKRQLQWLLVYDADHIDAMLLLPDLDQAPWVQKHILTDWGNRRRLTPSLHPHSAFQGNLHAINMYACQLKPMPG
jgi:hypothetical protein